MKITDDQNRYVSGSTYILLNAIMNSCFIGKSEIRNNQLIKKGTMGSGFNAFEDFVETEDEGLKKEIFTEKSEEEADDESRKPKKSARK